MQYQVGDYLMHKNSGVCVVDAIEEKALQGKGSERLYYSLKPVYQSKSTVTTPVDNEELIRDVRSPEELNELYTTVKELDIIEAFNDRQRGEMYKEHVKLFEPVELARVIKTVYIRRKERLAAGKKVMAQDEKMYVIASKKLFEEMAFAFHEEVSSVEEKFLQAIDG